MCPYLLGYGSCYRTVRPQTEPLIAPSVNTKQMVAIDIVGIALASVAAFTFALYYLCVRLATDTGRVHDVMLISLVVNVILIVPLVGIFHGIPTVTTQSILAFIGAGIVGSLLARLVVIKSVEAIGASRTSPVVASNVFFASLLAIILFDEQLTAQHLVGIVLIVAGVAAITWETAHEDNPDASLRDLGPSMFLPVLGAILLGFEPILVTFGLEGGTAVLPGVAIKATAATLGFTLYLRYYGALDADMFNWSSNMKWYIGAGVTSATGIVALFAALQSSPVVLVIPLIQTSPLIVVVLSALFLPKRLERITWPLVAGAIVVVIGATLVSLYG